MCGLPGDASPFRLYLTTGVPKMPSCILILWTILAFMEVLRRSTRDGMHHSGIIQVCTLRKEKMLTTCGGGK